MKSNYSQKLLDPRWQKKRLEILNRDGFMCQQCGDTENTLHVHHMVYIKGKEPWDVPSEILVTLCQSCHEEEGDEINGAVEKLVQAVKSKFFAYGIIQLAEGIEKYCMPHVSELCASVIAENLSDPNKAKRMIRESLKYVEIIEKEVPKNEESYPF